MIWASSSEVGKLEDNDMPFIVLGLFYVISMGMVSSVDYTLGGNRKVIWKFFSI